MRILCIADEYPLPATNGFRIRLANVAAGLAEAGEVDMFCTVSERPDVDDAAVLPGVARVAIHRRAPYRSSLAGVPQWLRSGWPRAVAWRDWDGPRAALAAWARPPYDAVWYSHCHPWLGLGDPSFGPAIVDLDNLEDEIMRRLLDLGLELDLGTTRRRSRSERIRRVMARIDIRRWTRAQRGAARAAARVVVCSNLDRTRLGADNALVIPNGFELASTARPTPVPGPVLLMVGLFTYEPNLDGAHYFAKQVLPLVQQRHPEAQFVLAGRHDGALDDIARVRGVTVLGPVADLGPVFATAAAVVIPLRSGSGTRIKVLEAFAHELPVVSTALGCEGIDVSPGRDVVIGDTPAAFAMACSQLLDDPALASSIAHCGHQLWRDKYQWSDIRHQIRDLAIEVAS